MTRRRPRRWLAILGPLLALSCGPAATAAVAGIVQLVDTVGHAVASVAGWCDQNADKVADAKDRLTRAKQAVDDRDLLAASGLLVQLADDVEKTGPKMPDEVRQARMLLGLLAAQAIQDGLRALSDPSKHWVDAGAAPR